MKYLFLVIFLLLSRLIFAQLSGFITDSNGNPLASASIYISGTTLGVNSNTKGAYSLNLPKGESEIVFQYIGYKVQRKKVLYNGFPIILNIILELQTLELSEIEIKANSEDPAYQIIRNTIAKREFYRQFIKSYSCDVYIKGNQKIVKIPKKLLGQDIGTLDGVLDTNRQGIVYLSESISKFYFQEPNDIKEELISSKVSGNSRGFSYNRARELRFNLYEPTINLGKQIISPISSGAFLFYKFKLEGSFYDDNGREINKIKVIPRNESDAVFRGYIFIYENSWNIHSCELAITGKSIKQEILDTLWLKQQYVPGKLKDEWLILSQSIDFKVKFIGIVLKGYFSAVYSNYNVNNVFPENFFSNEILKIESESNKKDKAYWDTIRPIPLLIEEFNDFTKKDSLEIRWNSKVFKDSTDRKGNKFTSNSLLLGYTYRNSFERWSYSIGSPLSTLQFDPVRGFYTSLAVKYRKERNEEATTWYSINPELTYGFSEKVFRGSLEFQKLFNKVLYHKMFIKSGISVEQFNDLNPITPTVNGLYNLYSKENYLKSYEKKYFKAGWSQRLNTVFNFETELELAQRSQLNNTTNYSFKKKDMIYSPNFPGDTIGAMIKHESFSFRTKLTLTPGMKYVSYPDFRIYLPSGFPEISINYELTHVLRYKDNLRKPYTIHNPELSVNYSFKPKFIGTSSVRVLTGLSIIQGDNVEFIDYKHFNGNQTFLNSSKGNLNAYRLLPYYDLSTLGKYAEGYFNHNFGGFFLGKIPIIKELKLEENIGAKFLFQEKALRYYEYSVGISNIGWSIFRLFRIDYSWSFQKSALLSNGITIGIALP